MSSRGKVWSSDGARSYRDMTECPVCGRPVQFRRGEPEGSGWTRTLPGRWRTYCSKGCRQKAYRERKREEAVAPISA